MRVLLIRHGKTKGNEERRYIGRTDESLSESGRKELLDKKKNVDGRFCAELVFASPMKRCVETAKLLFPEANVYPEERLTECNFGIFEYKNYQELNGNKDYQAWIDSGGNMDIPGGEKIIAFKKRSVDGFLSCVAEAERRRLETAIFVVHGGTIMAVLEALADPHKTYYDWQIKNGESYLGYFEDGRIKVQDMLSDKKRLAIQK